MHAAAHHLEFDEHEAIATSSPSERQSLCNYALAPHAFACIHSSEVVILDLKRDGYLSVDASSGKDLEAHVRGWPTDSGDSVDPHLAEEPLSVASQETLRSLIDRGLVTLLCDAEEVNGVGRTRPPVRSEWTGDIADADVVIEYQDIRRFLGACLGAQTRLRFHSLERLVRRAQGQRLRKRPARSNSNLSVWQVLAKYIYLRPWFFSATDMCMFECLVITEFLREFDHDIDWVFGVRAQPFSAHCWLQYEDTVVNDTVENVCRFAPIMVV